MLSNENIFECIDQNLSHLCPFLHLKLSHHSSVLDLVTVMTINAKNSINCMEIILVVINQW